MELDFFFGEAVVIRVTDKKPNEKITMDDVMPYDEKIREGTIILFNTNWYKKVGTEEFFEHPYVSIEVAEYLVNKGVRFLVSIRSMQIRPAGRNSQYTISSQKSD